MNVCMTEHLNVRMFEQTVMSLMKHIHDWQHIKSIVCDNEHKLNL